MHILVTNDDGPLSSNSSPYVLSLVRRLQEAGHAVSVCLPNTQRSWIGKAYLRDQLLQPLYYRPRFGDYDRRSSDSEDHSSPSGYSEEWVLVDGTPSACVQMGLYHYFQDKGPVDLVVSGPNYGRNTTTVYALSSGALGDAMEAAICCQKSIALSFALSTRSHDPVVIEAACRHSVQFIETLHKQWPANGTVDLYGVNLPLLEDVEKRETLWTDLLRNDWGNEGCYQELADPEGLAGESQFDKHQDMARVF